MKQRHWALAVLLVGSAVSPAYADADLSSFTPGELCELGTVVDSFKVHREVLEANIELRKLFNDDGFIGNWSSTCRYRINIGVEGHYDSQGLPAVQVIIHVLADERNTVLFVGGKQVKLNDNILLWSYDSYSYASDTTKMNLNDYSKMIVKIVYEMFKWNWN